MVKIKISKGLDIPLSGGPSGSLQALPVPPQIAWNFDAFDQVNFRLLVKPGDLVKIGQPLAEDKQTPGRYFISYAGGTVKEVRRGEKRRLRAIVIELSRNEEHVLFDFVHLSSISREKLVQKLMEAGFFAWIRSRPFNVLAKPHVVPRSIFVKAIESAPFAPSAEIQIAGMEREFQVGLDALGKLTEGPVHLVYKEGSSCKAFTQAQGVQTHQAEGPHPSSNVSVHIHYIDPILKVEDVVWTINAVDVCAIGSYLCHGRIWNERVIAIGGGAILEGKSGYFKSRLGHPIGALTASRIAKGWSRLISGDVLTGSKVGVEDFLECHHAVFCAIPEQTERELLHFCRIGFNKYNATGAYLSGHLDQSERVWNFTTSQHGEHRFFVDGAVYQKVMPMRIPVMQLVKALLAEDYDLAEELGLLEIDPEDFALPEFICPSKMDLTSILRKGIQNYSKEVLQ